MRNSGYSMWILLMVGWSIAGAVSGFLVTQLGFPYIWMTPFTLVMVGAMFFLAYRGYPIQAWLLAACVGFILISALAILRALTVSTPDIPEVYRHEFETADEDASFMGFPLYSDYSGDYYIEYQEDQTQYLVPSGYGMRVPITFQFAPIETAGGQWAFQSGSVQIPGGRIKAEQDGNWISAEEAMFVSQQNVESIQPEMTAYLPLPSEYGASVDATATVTITYPESGGEIKETTLTREIALLVFGDDYYAYWDQYTNWQRSRSIIESPVWMALVIGSLFAGVGSIYFVRSGALHPQPASGLMVVVKRFSGTEKLGAEVYTLDKVHHLTDAQQGVFVGRVNAQSAAGRGGLRTGDILIELAGETINHPRAVNRLAKGRRKGDRIPAVVLREGARVELLLRF